MDNKGILEKFVNDQLSVWQLAAKNFRALKSIEVKDFMVNGLKVFVQHNPERIKSTSAKVDNDTIKSRKCFLCGENRPQEQFSKEFEGRKNRKYSILLNPYPIFPHHLVIASMKHEEQSVWKRFGDIADLANHYTDFTFFYNGPYCGASAPDHLHFQACPRNIMPLEKEIDGICTKLCNFHTDFSVPDGAESTEIPNELKNDIEFMTSVQDAQLYHYKHFTKGVFALRSRTSKSMAKLFYKLLDCVPTPDGHKEPMFNLLVWYVPINDEHKRPPGYTHGIAGFEYRAIVLFRGNHRPYHFFEQGDKHLTISPGCADMAGLFIVPDSKDFSKINSELLSEILHDVSVSDEVEKTIIWKLTRKQPQISVGILSSDEIYFEILEDGAGKRKVSYDNGKINYNGALYDELIFDSKTMSSMFAEPNFIIYDVIIGVEFHWQRKVNQKFAGTLKFIVEKNKVVAVNLIGVEDYLLSVISSEMKSSASLEYLKAHSVISRSWVMSQIANRQKIKGKGEGLGDIKDIGSLVTKIQCEMPLEDTKDRDCPELIKWFDHDDHKKFDVCADDHCQRYQGLTMVVGDNVKKAIDCTWGEVLMYNNEICDARFSKCCGGRTEKFSACWEDMDYPYLPSLPDTPEHNPDAVPFCNTTDKRILSQVLNDYDLETEDFYRWHIIYGIEEISNLINTRSGFNIGILKDLIPIERGDSGRIIKLKVIGDKSSFIIGKELMIRRILSDSHLKSSDFEVKFYDDKVELKGKGWGHGVGMCQIGAAVMTDKGYKYTDILYHYYPNSKIEIK